MAKEFIFPSKDRKGHSILKLVVYFDGQKEPENVASFDGRKNKRTGKLMIWDDPIYWNERNGELYLKDIFDEKYRHHPRFLRAYYSDFYYPLGEIKSVWCKETNAWTSQETANKRAYQSHVKAYDATKVEQYSFRLSIPGYAVNGKINWQNFYTMTPSVGAALIELGGQYKRWQAQNPQIRLQPSGQIYGQIGKTYARTATGVPNLCFFDCLTGQPRYHRTAAHRGCGVVEEYAAIQDRAKDIEELVSNYTA